MKSKCLLFHLLRLLAVFLLLQSVGCAPKIYTSLQKSYPARPAGSAVLVYTLTDTLPSEADVLGNFEIRDNGFSTNCGYQQVLQLAKDQTNKVGGNGLVLTWHKEPSVFGSSCHQIAGNMLLISDSTYTVSYADNTSQQNIRASLLTIPANTAVKPISTPPSERKPCTILLSPGAAFITNEYLLPEGTTGNPKQGFNFNAAFQWVSRTGFGAGLCYSGYFSSYKDGDQKVSVRLHYIAPEFVMCQEIGRNHKWVFRETIGFGYALYGENMEDISIDYGGFGYHVDLGIEYRLSPSVGIGIGVGGYFARFKAMDYLTEKYASGKKAGISYISVNGGLQFYF